MDTGRYRSSTVPNQIVQFIMLIKADVHVTFMNLGLSLHLLIGSYSVFSLERPLLNTYRMCIFHAMKQY